MESSSVPILLLSPLIPALSAGLDMSTTISPTPSVIGMSQDTLMPTSASVPKSEAIRKLLVSLAPSLTLLASMTTAAGVSGAPPLSAGPVMTGIIISIVERPRVQASVVESLATASV